jgi:lipoate-protein ligase A
MNNSPQSLELERAACNSPISANAFFADSATRIACFHDPPSRGSWNMALDEALLFQAAEGSAPTLRFYQWDQPTLSLGYFQRYADRALHLPSVDCSLVRRTTGGGAILHDQELTYSCTLPSGHRLVRRSIDFYYAIHESIVSTLARFGLVAHLQSCNRVDLEFKANALTGGCGANVTAPCPNAIGAAIEPFLCFQRRTAGDIIFNNQKIVGSAQRRCRGAVLQHGSILLATSKYAPELPGIWDLGCPHFATRDLAVSLRSALSDRLQFEFAPGSPSSETWNRATVIERSKFAAESWRQLR